MGGNITFLPETKLMSSFFLYILEYQKSDKNWWKKSLNWWKIVDVKKDQSVICSAKSKTYHHYWKSIDICRYFNAFTEPLSLKLSDWKNSLFSNVQQHIIFVEPTCSKARHSCYYFCSVYVHACIRGCVRACISPDLSRPWLLHLCMVIKIIRHSCRLEAEKCHLKYFM